jgi:hypothetical protein
MKCPICNSSVVYAGLTLIECEGADCQNYKAPKFEWGPDDEIVGNDWIEALFRRIATGAGAEFTKTFVSGRIVYRGMPGYPLGIACDGPAYVSSVRKWILLYHPTWLEYLK